MLDHYYDKLLHIGKPAKLQSGNAYILAVAAERHHYTQQLVLNFWQHPAEEREQWLIRQLESQ
jgi:hypothetical protein